MDIAKQVVILSAHNNLDTAAENAARTELLDQYLLGAKLSFKRTMGAFQGTKQESFVVIVNDNEDIEIVKNCAFINFNQNAVLHQDANRQAHLLSSDGTIKTLGKLDVVPESVAVATGSYTIMNDQFYSVVN